MILGVEHDKPVFLAPPLSCDCHTHIFGPVNRFPLALSRTYTPDDASIENLLELHKLLGIERVVIVHPSPYGSDNSCTVDAVKKIGNSARGVAVIDRGTSEKQLNEMHESGIRGVRINLETSGIQDPAFAEKTLADTAKQIASLGWHIQIFSNLAVIASLQDSIRALDIPIVIDHFGGAKAALGTTQKNFETILGLVQEKKVWVKLSAPYRISTESDFADASALAKELISANENQMLWGSDWPHPGGLPGKPRRIDTIEPFRPINDGRILNLFASWVDSPSILKKILVDNPEKLYDF